MAKQLVIAEKPSVARDIASALGGFENKKDYYESDEMVISSAVGHLLELVVPEKFDVKRGKWTFTHLPLIPPFFTLSPIKKTEDRLKLILRLIKRKDITSLVNACDAGREGELIFRNIIEYAFPKKPSKPIQRLWLQSMTKDSIRKGFQALRSDEEMIPLSKAARCRAESDWLIGINGTRAMTAFNSKGGGFFKTTVGRVQTPTLAILVQRESVIREFKAKPYYEIKATFTAQEGQYQGTWFNESFVKQSDNEHARDNRIWEREKALEIQAQCLKQPAKVEEKSKPKVESPPLLFDLTSLQREANARHGFTARTTLSAAQALYERHKVLTYPRTDSRYLPEDYLKTVPGILSSLSEISSYLESAEYLLKNNRISPNKRIFNDKQITDHFAIIPTGQLPKSLSEVEQKIYDLVTKRFLAVFYPPAKYEITTRLSRIDEHVFKIEGKVLVEAGWLVVYGRHLKSGEEGSLIPIKSNELIQADDIEVLDQETKPPPRYSEATLLSAMEGAGKLIENDELRMAMSERGLGTPATRASIIEGLLMENYVIREGRDLLPTAKANNLLFALEQLGVNGVCSPQLTGQWEWKLSQVEQNKLIQDDFMAEIKDQSREMVERIKTGEFTDPDFGTLKAPCPRCGGKLHESYRFFKCADCDYEFGTVLANRQWELDEVELLLEGGKIGPLSGFRSKQGFPFSALVRLGDEDKKPTFEFEDKQGKAVDLDGKPVIGSCPKCQSDVYAADNSFLCEKANLDKESCNFRVSRTILQQPISDEDVIALLQDKKTKLLTNFISNRTRRKFSAFLTLDAQGKIGFEFEKKEKKATSLVKKKSSSRTRKKT